MVSVLDGNTIEVLHNRHPERIRLSGIDCPEKSQAFGKGAQKAASELVYGKEATLERHGLDQYGRTLADVRLFDGTNVNHKLVKDGWCWWYRKYAPGDPVLERLVTAKSISEGSVTDSKGLFLSTFSLSEAQTPSGELVSGKIHELERKGLLPKSK